MVEGFGGLALIKNARGVDSGDHLGSRCAGAAVAVVPVVVDTGTGGGGRYGTKTAAGAGGGGKKDTGPDPGGRSKGAGADAGGGNGGAGAGVGVRGAVFPIWPITGMEGGGGGDVPGWPPTLSPPKRSMSSPSRSLLMALRLAGGGGGGIASGEGDNGAGQRPGRAAARSTRLSVCRCSAAWEPMRRWARELVGVVAVGEREGEDGDFGGGLRRGARVGFGIGKDVGSGSKRGTDLFGGFGGLGERMGEETKELKSSKSSSSCGL